MSIKHKNYFLLALVLIVVDQLSKLWAAETLGVVSKEVTDFLSFTFAKNYGAAFSFLANQGGWQRYFLIGVSTTASVVIIIWMFKTVATHRIIALAFVLSGAIGNMIDRIYQGFVIDFIDFHYAGWHFPIFNVADICINIGVLLLILTEFKKS